MRSIPLFALLLLGALAFTSCSKTNRFAERLEGETWRVEEIQIDGKVMDIATLPIWDFEDCDHHDELCFAHWEVGADHADFIWQFNENGEKFTISNQSDDDHNHDHGDDHNHDHGDDHNHGSEWDENPIHQCEELSGTYDVVEAKLRNMEFVSSNTYGHNGEEVRIKIVKID